MLTHEQARSIKRTLAFTESARSELRGLNLGDSSLDLEAANSLVMVQVKLQMLLPGRNRRTKSGRAAARNATYVCPNQA